MKIEIKKKKYIKKHKMAIFIMVSTIVMFIGLSYAWLQITLRGEKELTLTAGSLSLVLDDSMAGGIAMSEVVPILDEEGLSQEGYTFVLENRGKIDSDYTIYLDDLDLLEDQHRMNDGYIKYQLTRDGKETRFDLLNTTGENPNRILDSGILRKGKNHTYTLKMWIDSNADNQVMGTVFKGELRVDAIQSATKPIATEILLDNVNPADLAYENATSDEKKEMFTFTHTAGSQQAGWSAEELTDYRYIGTSPNNYVRFNDVIWRIIGIFTVEDENGKKEKRLKITQNANLGTYSFDNSSSTGVNDWSTSKLQKALNNQYYNRTSGYSCPYDTGWVNCHFDRSGLTSEARKMVGDAKWYLGALNTPEVTVSEFYEYERGTTVYSENSTNFIEKVGLIYPSDYGYATSESSCKNVKMSDYSSVCTNANWFFTSSANNVISRWTITPTVDNASDVYYINLNGQMNTKAALGYNNLYPSIYLKSSVQITSGDGSTKNPYQLKI